MKKITTLFFLLIIGLTGNVNAQKVTINHSIIAGSENFPGESITPDTIMFFDYEKAAFRAGNVSASGAYWAPSQIGFGSFAANRNTIASGQYASAFGNRTIASGQRSFATGYFSEANGQYAFASGFSSDALGDASTALGFNTDAQAFASVAVGRYNEGGGNATSWVASDPVFEVGIGSSTVNRENAMTIKKDGSVALKEYTLPNEDGAPNQVLSTDGNGQTSWTSTSKFQNFIDFRATISNGSWTVPADVNEILIEFWSAGGGGALGGGGGAGGYMKTILEVIPGEVFTVDLGDGGIGVANGQNINATNGEQSTISSSEGLQIFGIGGKGATQTNNGNGGTVAASLNLPRIMVIDGEPGRKNTTSYYSSSTTLTKKQYGRGGNAPSFSYSSGGEGDVEFIANGSMVQISNEGSDGRRPGGGGGGGHTYKNDGGKAYAIIRW